MIVNPKKNFFKNYVLCNGGLHLFRFVNTNFGSKWAGLWNFDRKLLDYWAYRINGEWLSMHNCFEFEHKLWCANHRHRTGDLVITEEVVPCKDIFVSLLKVRNNSQSRTRARIDLEVGVNIRHRDTNRHGYEYSVKTHRSMVEIENEIGSLYFLAPKGEFAKKECYGEHNPGIYAESCGYLTKPGLKGSWNEEMQSKYVPGEYWVEIDLKPGEEKEVPFFFSEKKIKGYRKYTEWVKKSERDFKRLRSQYRDSRYSESLDRMISCLMTFESEKGFIAGYPFFNEVWVRDACWCVPAYLYLGMFGHVKKFLREVGKKIEEGKAPGLINSKAYFYDSADASPLWIISLYDYLDFTGDEKFGKEMLEKVKEVLNYGKSRLQDNLVTDQGHTWMDSVKRDKAIDLQALWCRAFYCGGMMLHTNNENAGEYFRTSSRMLEEIEKKYWGPVPKDNLGKNFASPNFLFQLALMHVSRDVSKHLFDILSSDYLTPAGIMSRPSSDAGHDPRGYHTGCVWPFLTMIAALAQCNYEKTENVKRLLRINMSNFGRQCVNGINEIFNADNLRPRGCTSQAWSMAGMLAILDSYVLGIRPKLTEKIIILDPSKFYLKKFDRKIKIGNKRVSLSYARKDNKIELKVKNLPVKAKIPNIYKKCFLNRRQKKDRVIVLQPKKTYTLLMEL